jgi:lipopolysaccharide biosynthesis regulator YciM
MEIDKSKVLALLRQRGLNDRAIWVDRTLPDRIDVYTNSGLFSTLNIDPAELADDVPAES